MKQPKNKIHVLILSNHMCLGLYKDLSSLYKGLTSFTQAVDKLRQMHSGITVQIISVQLLLPTHIPSSTNDADILTSATTFDATTSVTGNFSSSVTDHTYRIQSGMYYIRIVHRHI